MTGRVVWLVLIVLWWPRVALAQPVVTESYTGSRPDTARTGVITTGIGGSALIAGLWPSLRNKSASGPIASASRDGRYIGWFTRFTPF